MIAAIEGILESRGTNWGIIKINGVSLQIYMPASTLSQLNVGERVQLYTYLKVKEENIALYGFTTQEEVELFRRLISVDGVGPKVALALLSALSSEQLASAIESGNTDVLDRVPGLGKKTANRLVVELKGKLDKSFLKPSSLSQENADIMSVLTNLGYSVAQANRAIAEVPQSPDLSLEDRIKIALQWLASH